MEAMKTVTVVLYLAFIGGVFSESSEYSDSTSVKEDVNFTMPAISQADTAEALTAMTYLYSASDDYIASVDSIISMSDTEFSSVNTVTANNPSGATWSKISLGINIFTAVIGIFQDSRRNRHLENMNNKLKVIYNRMLQMEDSLIASIEFNGWMPMYAEYVSNIQAGMANLHDTSQQIRNAQDERSRLRFAQDFITFYETNRIEISYRNLYKASTQSHTFKNIFELYVNDRGCLAHSVSKLYLILNSVLFSGALQMSTYSFLRHGDWELAKRPVVENHENSFNVRDTYYHHVWNCLNYFQKVAEKEIVSFLERSTDSTELQSLLGSKFPLYDWTTLTYRTWNSRVGCRGVFNNRNLNNIGDCYIKVSSAMEEDKKAVAIFTYRLYSDMFRSDCPRAAEGRTIVYFPGSASIRTDSKTLTSSMCPGERRSVAQSTSGCNVRSSDDVRFISAEFERQVDNCAAMANPCRGNGICRMIPHTDLHYCECRPFYVGPDCERFELPEAGEKLTKAIANLQLKAKDFLGVPDIIDLYFGLRQAKETLQNELAYNRQISLGGNTWSRTSFILDQYMMLIEGEISETTFQQRMSDLDNTPYYTLRTNYLMVTGGHAGQEGVDYMTVYKKALYDPVEGCSESYVQDIKSMMNQIIYIDMILTEVCIRQEQYAMEQLHPKQQKLASHKSLHEVLKAEDRWLRYSAVWANGSCDSLDYTHLQNPCATPGSFEGMQIKPSCGNNMFTSLQPGQLLVCRKYEAGLAWSPKTSCMDCVQRFQQFKCNTGACIDKSLVCNGFVDCPGSAMEDEVGCPRAPITSGSHVRLAALDNRGFLDWSMRGMLSTTEGPNQETLVQSVAGFGGYWLRSGDIIRVGQTDDSRILRCTTLSCSLSTCSTRSGTTYGLYAVGQRDGYIIRSGDQVSLQIKDTSGTSSWVGAGSSVFPFRCQSIDDMPSCSRSFTGLWKIHKFFSK